MMRKSALGERLHQQATALGADFYGVADISPGQRLAQEMGGEMVAGYHHAVSIGVAMPSAIVDQLPDHDRRTVAMTYQRHGYDILNMRLDQIVSRLASLLQGEGYRPLPVPASQTIDEQRRYGLFSHKLAAHLAGLGWIGKSCLLVTPEVGPRARWASILTNAPLASGTPLEERCGQCNICVDACPAQAFTGEPFRVEEPREARFDVQKCFAYQRRQVDTVGVILCGMCVYACPHGRCAQQVG